MMMVIERSRGQACHLIILEILPDSQIASMNDPLIALLISISDWEL